MMDNIINTGLIDGVFAVAVAAYLLTRIDKRLEHLTQAINDLSVAVAAINERTQHHD